MKKVLVAVVLLVFVSGCALTESGSKREYQFEIENEEGVVLIEVNLSNESETDTTSGDAPASQTTSPSTALGMQGSTATASGGEVLLKGVKSLLDQYMDNSVQDVVTPQQPEQPLPPVGPVPEPDEEESETDEPDVSGDALQELDYWGRYNGDRPLWYAWRPMADFGDSFLVEVEGCGSILVEDNNGVRFENEEEYPQWVVKESDVSGRGMAVHAPSNCQSKKATVLYSE